MVVKMPIFHSADYQAVTSMMFKILIISKLAKITPLPNIFSASCLI